MGQPPVLQAERCPQELHTKEGFYKQEAGGVKKLLAKQKKEVLQAWASSLWGKGKAERSPKQIISLELIGNFQVDCLSKGHVPERC